MEKKKRGAPALAAGAIPALRGAALSAGTLLLLVFLAALGIWSGFLPAETPGLVLTGAAGLCAFLGGRTAARRNGQAAGLLTAALLGLLMILLRAGCGAGLGPGPWVMTLLTVLAGGCLASLFPPRRRKR